MARSKFDNILIKGIASAVPKVIIDNIEGHPFVDPEEKQKMVKLTGMRQYRKAPVGVCSSDLCVCAAAELFKVTNIRAKDIDAILFVTQTPDYRLPSTACIIQHELGCSQKTLAFDINLGCSGYVYGLYTACSFIQGGGLQNVLLLCGESQTKLADEGDKNVWFIMGDAGSASLISREDKAAAINFSLMTDGSRFDKLIVPYGGYRHPSNDESREVKLQAEGGIRSQEHIFMEGMEIFNFAATDVVITIREFMHDNDISEAEVDYLILHQANKFMTDKVAKKLKFSPDKVLYSLEYYGNTSSASIPLTISQHMSRDTQIRKRCIISGFGVGLSWGVANIDLEGTICPGVAEV